MKILHRYILVQLLRNLLLCLMVVVFLFLVFDFFDRIDNIMAEDVSVFTIAQYFLFKIPLTMSLMLPVAMMASILFTIGIMSKNSEITAMRASGATVRWIATPLFLLGFSTSLFAIMLNETIIPYCQRRAHEIYNIDIRQKDKSGSYSQSDFWWRAKDSFYSVGTFDSRTSTLHDISIFEINDRFAVHKRIDAVDATWVDPLLGWNMSRVMEYRFDDQAELDIRRYKAMPLPIKEQPADFYDVKTQPQSMSFKQLRKFIRTQSRNGLDVTGYLANLYEKISFPFINFIVTLVVLPFALKPARSGSMATSVISALVIGFSYYAIHSFSIAMGRAEILPPMLSAWTANLLMGFVGAILLLGAESPS